MQTRFGAASYCTEEWELRLIKGKPPLAVSRSYSQFHLTPPSDIRVSRFVGPECGIHGRFEFWMMNSHQERQLTTGRQACHLHTHIVFKEMNLFETERSPLSKPLYDLRCCSEPHPIALDLLQKVEIEVSPQSFRRQASRVPIHCQCATKHCCEFD